MQLRPWRLILVVSVCPASWLLAEDVQRRQQGNLIIEGIPEIPPVLIQRMMQYQNTRSARFVDWDPASTEMLINTRFGETSQFHAVGKPGGMRRQLTFFDEPVGEGRMCPNPSTRLLLFTKDVGGGEFYQVFQFNLEDGSYRMLTDGKSRNGSIQWSPGGGRFAYYTTKRNGRDWDIALCPTDNPIACSLVERTGTWVPVDWATDNNRLLINNYVSANESYYHVLNMQTGRTTQINPSDERISYGEAVFAIDGKGVYYTSDEGTDFEHLRYYDLASGRSDLLSADIHWDVNSVSISKQGDRLVFVTNEDGIDRLYLLNTKTRRYEAVPDLPVGQISAVEFHPDGVNLALTIQTPASPSDVYLLNTQTQSLTRWTFSEVGGLDTAHFVEPELIHYPTFDQVDGKPRQIPAFVYRPKHGAGPCPVIIMIHGGPEGQYTPSFSSTVQYWINELGAAVIAPNVRGSAGYGKSYLLLDNGYQREDSVKDIGKLLDWIQTQPDLDAARVCVYGGSYGGYMVLASMTHYNERLKCAVDIVGISNFVTFLENTREYRRDLRRAEYGDERDPNMRAFLEKISPTASAHKITKPMFIAQGQNDPRVPVGESEQIVKAVRGQDNTVWYMLATDEGHGFRKKTNRDYFNHATVLFLEKFLLQ